jgi:hypothetical protein
MVVTKSSKHAEFSTACKVMKLKANKLYDSGSWICFRQEGQKLVPHYNTASYALSGNNFEQIPENQMVLGRDFCPKGTVITFRQTSTE